MIIINNINNDCNLIFSIKEIIIASENILNITKKDKQLASAKKENEINYKKLNKNLPLTNKPLVLKSEIDQKKTAKNQQKKIIIKNPVNLEKNNIDNKKIIDELFELFNKKIKKNTLKIIFEQQREINESDDNTAKEESEDEENEDAKIELENKDLLLGNEPISISLSSHSLCGKRILALINQNNYDPSKKSYTINPNLCSFFREEEGKNLYQEPGIPQLEALYKDNFDYQTGQFISSLSNEAKKEYQEAINLLYKAFTGKSNTTGSFSAVPLISLQ